MGSGQGDGEMPPSDRELWNRRGQDQGRASQFGLEWHWRWGPRECHARRRTEAQQFPVQIEVGIFVGRFVVDSGTRSVLLFRLMTHAARSRGALVCRVWGCCCTPPRGSSYPWQQFVSACPWDASPSGAGWEPHRRAEGESGR